MPDRDTVQTQRGGRAGPRIPLVQLQDPTYEDRSHIPLVDDQERHALAQVVLRENAEDWRKGIVTDKDRRQAHVWGAVVALASVGALGVSILDLVLHLTSAGVRP